MKLSEIRMHEGEREGGKNTYIQRSFLFSQNDSCPTFVFWNWQKVSKNTKLIKNWVRYRKQVHWMGVYVLGLVSINGSYEAISSSKQLGLKIYHTLKRSI